MKRFLLRAFTLLLVLCLVLGIAACGSRGKTLLSLKKDGISVTFSVNEYQLMLCRMKATLSSLQNVNSTDFWNSWVGSPAKTMDQHYRDSILDNCKSYLIALYLFEKEGLTLSNADKEEVDALMEELIKTDGNGSKVKLNEVLSSYGVNYDILKDLYTLEKKIEVLQLHLYGKDASLIGDDIKNTFLTENYVHCKQIYLPTLKYVYEKDALGGEVYYKYNESTNTITTTVYYDVYNGWESTETDKNGDKIFYTDETKTKIAYDTVNGKRVRQTNSDGTYKTAARTEEELAVVKADLNALLASLENATDAEFEEQIAAMRAKYYMDAEENTDGYYIKRMDYSIYGTTYKHYTDIINACDAMENGEIASVESASGYHIIRKYAFTEKAYDLEANKEGWFADFNEVLINKLFSELCSQYVDDVKVDEEVYALAPSMKEIVPSYFY